MEWEVGCSLKHLKNQMAGDNSLHITSSFSSSYSAFIKGFGLYFGGDVGPKLIPKRISGDEEALGGCRLYLPHCICHTPILFASYT